jgi:hypothetical protein
MYNQHRARKASAHLHYQKIYMMKVRRQHLKYKKTQKLGHQND